jgi:hypothetical protein
MGSVHALNWLTAVSTAVAAFGTLAAVLTTLYFNIWRPRLRRPKLSLGFIEESEWGVGWTPNHSKDDDWSCLSNVVRNKVGRSTAYDVQVLVSVAIELSDGEWHDSFVQQPLLWKTGRSPRSGTTTTTISPGIAREISTLIIGEPNAVWEQLAPFGADSPVADTETGQELAAIADIGDGVNSIAAAVAVSPATKEDVVWVYREGKYRFRFTVTARDIDAVTLESFLTFTFEVNEDHLLGTHFLQPHWTDLEVVREASQRLGV